MAASFSFLRAGVSCLLQNCKTLVHKTYIAPILQNQINSSLQRLRCSNFSTMSGFAVHKFGLFSNNICRPSLVPSTPVVEQVRTKVRYSRRGGKPKSVKAVPARFFRLNWGIWIRTRAGRAKRLWRKTTDRKYRLRQHVFCNGTQSKLLDKMVTEFWKRPKYWVNDPYEPYHKRQHCEHFFHEKRPFFP